MIFTENYPSEAELLAAVRTQLLDLMGYLIVYTKKNEKKAIKDPFIQHFISISRSIFNIKLSVNKSLSICVLLTNKQ